MAEAMARRGPQVTGIDPAADAIDAARAHARAPRVCASGMTWGSLDRCPTTPPVLTPWFASMYWNRWST